MTLPPSNARARRLRRLALAVAACAAATAAGCAQMQAWMAVVESWMPKPSIITGGGDAPGEPGCPALALGHYASESLCADGGCPACYAIALDRAGDLRVDVVAPAELAPLRVDVVDESGATRASGEWSRRSTTKLLHERLAAGRYALRVAAADGAAERGDWDIKATIEPLSPDRAVRRPTTTTPPPTTTTPPTPVPEAAPSEAAADTPPACDPASRLLLLAVERDAAGALVLELNQGSSDGIEVGAIAHVLRGDALLGRARVTDVLPSGSRARLVSSAAADIGAGDVDELDVCLRLR